MITPALHRRPALFHALGLTVLAAGLAFGQAAPQDINIFINENCTGTIQNTSFGGPISALPCGFFADAGPGGLPSALFYGMFNPPGMVGGDVILQEFAGGPFSDLLRFDALFQGGGIFFYSDIEAGDPNPALADTGFPGGLNTNVLTLPEAGPEGNNGIVYIPTAGQPGFVPGYNVTYTVVSDEVPEPATAGLFVLGGGALIYLARRKRKSE